MRLNVKERGQGERTAVLIHGLSNSSSTWNSFAGELVSRGYRVLTPDLRGHGDSPRGEYSPDRWAEDLVDSLPTAADLVIGHSLGGVALVLAADRLAPRRVIYEDPAWLVPAAVQASSAARFLRRKQETLEDIRSGNPRWSEEVVVARHAGFAKWDPDTVAGMHPGVDLDVTPTLPPGRPSLVLLPDPSPLVPPANVERLRGLGWQVERISGARHWIHLDEPRAYLEAVLRFTEQS